MQSKSFTGLNAISIDGCDEIGERVKRRPISHASSDRGFPGIKAIDTSSLRSASL
jgi:hypothetical protein